MYMDHIKPKRGKEGEKGRERERERHFIVFSYLSSG